MTTTHRPAEHGALLSTSTHQLTTLYPSFPLEVPTLHRNNTKIFSENTFCLSTGFFFFKTKPALLFLGTCSWEKSLAPASLCSRAGVCPNKWDIPVLETVLLLIAELVSFFLALNSSKILRFTPFIFSHLFAGASLFIFLKSAILPTFCCSLSGLVASNTLLPTLAPAQLSSFPFLTLLLHSLPFAPHFPLPA